MANLLAVSLAALLLLTACGLQQDLSDVPNPGNGPTGPATPINDPTLVGKQFDWSTTRGHVVVLDFWGSWCSPCNDEQPALDTLAAQWPPKGVIFLGVDERDPTANGLAYE